MKQYMKLSRSSFYLFVFIFFFILVGATSESALERLRWEAREKEVERKVKAFRREHIEKKRAKHVWLFKVIYVKPLVSHTLAT
jgi:hypothetical protein